MPKINRHHLFNYAAPIPLLEQQHAIAANLNVLANQTEFLEGIYCQKIGWLEMLKQSLLHKAFTGELTADPKAADRTLSEAGL